MLQLMLCRNKRANSGSNWFALHQASGFALNDLWTLFRSTGLDTAIRQFPSNLAIPVGKLATLAVTGFYCASEYMEISRIISPSSNSIRLADQITLSKNPQFTFRYPYRSSYVTSKREEPSLIMS